MNPNVLPFRPTDSGEWDPSVVFGCGASQTSPCGICRPGSSGELPVPGPWVGTYPGSGDITGNLTEEYLASARTTYVYDNENRLTNVRFSGGTRSTYTFDGDGLRRSAFEAGGVLTTTIWDSTDYLMEKS